MPALSDLITALAAATGPSRELDERIAVEVFGWTKLPDKKWWVRGPEHDTEARFYTWSLDVMSRAIREKWLLPDWAWSIETHNNGAVIWNAETQLSEARAWAATPALALCLAAARLAAAEAADAPAG